MPSDGTEKQPDVTLTADKTGTPPKTYTEEEHQKAVRDARSAVMADAIRAKKVAEDALSRMDKMMKEQEENELESAQDNPGLLTAIRERQARKKVESELNQARQELNERDERLKQLDTERAETSREANVNQVAARLGVDAARLAKLAKFTDGSLEVIEDLAKELPKKEDKPLRPDSGGTMGGSKAWETIRLKIADGNASPSDWEEYAKMRKERGV